jgi:hypothetical protein
MVTVTLCPTMSKSVCKNRSRNNVLLLLFGFGESVLSPLPLLLALARGGDAFKVGAAPTIVAAGTGDVGCNGLLHAFFEGASSFLVSAAALELLLQKNENVRV